jgi:hypothetical protein
VENQIPPDAKQLAKELGKFAIKGLGRGLPGTQNEKTVQALADISRELAVDPSEDWPLRIARVVIAEVKAIKPPQPDQLALADVLAIGDSERDIEEIIADIEAGAAVKGIENRHQRAAERYTRTTGGHITAKTFADDYRPELLKRVGDRLLEKLKTKHGRAEGAVAPVPTTPGNNSPMASGTASDAGASSVEPPIFLVGAIGLLLVVIGAAWLIAVAVGAIS